MRGQEIVRLAVDHGWRDGGPGASHPFILKRAGFRPVPVRNRIENRFEAQAILKQLAENDVPISGDGVLEVLSGGFGFRRGGLGSFITMDNPQGGEAKALLTASDGSGLRCDLKLGYSRGGFVCRYVRGRLYDVQIRATRK